MPGELPSIVGTADAGSPAPFYRVHKIENRVLGAASEKNLADDHHMYD
jgi:hypothetical protein